jgi:hypothetical protein
MIQSPVLIIGCPRSGTTLLFNVLSEVPSLYSIGYESKAIIERFHHPSAKGWDSGALDASDVTSESRRFILAAFERQAAGGDFWRRVNRLRGRLRGSRLWTQIKRRGQTETLGSAPSSLLPQQGLDAIRAYVRARNLLLPHSKNRPIRLLEKTPENCLRLPFLLELFPDARVIYLTRDGRSNVHSLVEGWKQPHLFPGYRVPEPLHISGYSRDRWAFTLIPGWRELAEGNHSLEEVCAWQWIRCNEAVLEHRTAVQGRVPYLTLRYEDLVAQPASTLGQIAAFVGLDLRRDLAHYAGHLPRINVVSAPDREKWRRREGMAAVLPLIEPMMAQLGYDSSS